MPNLSSLQSLLDKHPSLGGARVEDARILKSFERPQFKGHVVVIADGELWTDLDAEHGVTLPPPKEIGQAVVIKDDAGLYIYMR